MSSSEEILDVLKKLKESDKTIQATMVAKVGLEGIIMFPEEFKEDASAVWDPLSKNLDEMLMMVKKYGEIGLEREYSEILGYGICLRTLKKSDTALVAITKGKGIENICQIMGLMEKSCEGVYKILGF